MMTVCRYTCAIIVFLGVSLTPRSCSDVNEQAMAADDPKATVVSESNRTDAEADDQESSDLGQVYDIGS